MLTANEGQQFQNVQNLYQVSSDYCYGAYKGLWFLRWFLWHFMDLHTLCLELTLQIWPILRESKGASALLCVVTFLQLWGSCGGNNSAINNNKRPMWGLQPYTELGFTWKCWLWHRNDSLKLYPREIHVHNHMCLIFNVLWIYHVNVYVYFCVNMRK